MNSPARPELEAVPAPRWRKRVVRRPVDPHVRGVFLVGVEPPPYEARLQVRHVCASPTYRRSAHAQGRGWSRHAGTTRPPVPSDAGGSGVPHAPARNGRLASPSATTTLARARRGRRRGYNPASAPTNHRSVTRAADAAPDTDDAVAAPIATPASAVGGPSWASARHRSIRLDDSRSRAVTLAQQHAAGASSLKGWGVVKDVLSCFDLDVDSTEPTPVSMWSARSAARTNDLDDGAERFSACSVGVEADEHRRLCDCGATSPQ